jgi:hypothetical protein
VHDAVPWCFAVLAVERALPSAADVYPIMQDWDTLGKSKFVFMCKLYTESLGLSDDPKIVYLLYIQVTQCAPSPRGRWAASAVPCTAMSSVVTFT